jgi:hypothetical protein
MASLPRLPHGTSSTLALVHPTKEELLVQSKLNGAIWRGALSLKEYLRREEVLSSQALTRDGGISFWILIDTEVHNALDPDAKERLPLASCETYRKKAWVWRNGKIQETVAHGIGSVFCPSHLRKRGYAARMMQEVGRALQTHQTEDQECLFSVLYSDIGKEFYASHGWEPFNSSHISVPGVVKSLDGLPEARPLYEEDLEELCKIDEELVRKTLSSRSTDSNVAVALIPNIETVRWHHAREDFVGKVLHGKAPKVKGAIVGSEKGKRIWCYWTRMWYNQNPEEAKGNTLHILRLVIESEGQSSWETSRNGSNGVTSHQHDAAIAALLSMAQKEAEEWRMEEVEAWNPSSETVAAAQRLDPNAKVVDRDMESIASLRWYPQHEGPVADSIDWIGNEKYGWC